MPKNRRAIETQPESSRESSTGKLPPALLSTVLELWREGGKEAWIRSQGTSMQPLIREGDRLLVSYHLDSVRRGSILLFSQGDRLIAHRLLKVLPGSPPLFITKGDHGWSFDAPVRADKLVGQVIALQKQGRVIALDAPKWQAIGWVIATAGLAVALAHGWLRRVKQRWGGQSYS
jgi:hypothetical protein